MRHLRLLSWGGVVSLTVALLGVTGCRELPDPWGDEPGKRVVTSFAPIHCFALNVAGKDAVVRTIMTERGPHHFTSTPRDVKLLERADIFFINGLDLDNDVAGVMTKGARNPGLKVIEAGKRIPVKDLREGGCNCGHDHDHGKHDDDASVKYDPHVWLGIPEAIHMVESIRDELKALDLEHAAGYESRAAAYIAKLSKLAADGRELLKDKKERKLIAFHDSLFYFARSFDLTIVDSVEITPGAPAGGKKLQQLIKMCQEQNVRLITVEPQYETNTSAGTLRENLKSKGIDAAFVEIDPLETANAEDLKSPELYEKIMRKNLAKLAEKLR